MSKGVLNPEYVCSFKYKTVQADKGIEPPFSSRDTKSVPLKEQFKGQLQGKINAREMTETAFIFPTKKADCWQRKQIVSHLIPGSPRLISQHEASDQKSQMEIYLPHQMSCIQINFSSSNTNPLQRYNVKIQSLCNHALLFHSILAFYY